MFACSRVSGCPLRLRGTPVRSCAPVHSARAWRSRVPRGCASGPGQVSRSSGWGGRCQPQGGGGGGRSSSEEAPRARQSLPGFVENKEGPRVKVLGRRSLQRPGESGGRSELERGEGLGLEARSRPRRCSAQAHSQRAASSPRLHPGSFAAASTPPPPPLFLLLLLLLLRGLHLLFLLRSLLRRFSRRGAGSPRPAPGLAVPCCPGGGAEGWRRPSLRLPRGTCGCCGCCSPA